MGAQSEPDGGRPRRPDDGGPSRNGRSASPGWRDAATRALSSLTGAPVRPYSTYNFGREKDERCVSVVTTGWDRPALLAELRRQLPGDTVAFVGTSRWLGKERHEGREVVVGPGRSQFDILRLAQTDGANFDLETEDIVAKLAEYDRAHGIDIWHAETDTVEFHLLRAPADLAAFAADVYEFCPDIVDQGVGSVEALAEAIEALGGVYLWWD